MTFSIEGVLAIRELFLAPASYPSTSRLKSRNATLIRTLADINLSAEDDSITRIAVGLNRPHGGHVGLIEADGDSPIILAYNENKAFVGISDSAFTSHIPSGGYSECLSVDDALFCQENGLVHKHSQEVIS